MYDLINFVSYYKITKATLDLYEVYYNVILNLLLWLFIAEDFSGCSYWELNGAGTSCEGNSSIIPFLHHLIVSVISFSTWVIEG